MPAARFFLDTNVLLYAFGDDPRKRTLATTLLAGDLVISTQVLSETANVALRKFGFSPTAVRDILATLEGTTDLRPVTPVTIRRAVDLSERYGFSFFDSQILASAIEAGCAILYSEDFQHGQKVADNLSVIDHFR
ncbi:MAG: PIN domain-containing protein [Rhodospirillales bacterium]|nr:PIN domain-containing protein [Rhodospirillales bacterium]